MEKAFFQAKGHIPSPKYRAGDGTLKDIPPPDPVFVTDAVRAVCHKYELPANEVWGHTITDLFVMLRPPEDADMESSDRGGQIMDLLLLDERITLLAKLAVWERIELETWKAELM